MSGKEKDNPGHITRAEFTPVVQDVDTIKLALFGEDGRGGIVRDISQIKHSMGTMNFVKGAVISVMVAVLSALIISCVV